MTLKPSHRQSLLQLVPLVRLVPVAVQATVPQEAQEVIRLS